MAVVKVIWSDSAEGEVFMTSTSVVFTDKDGSHIRYTKKAFDEILKSYHYMVSSTAKRNKGI